MSEKPILFNTEMVRAILNGRKTVTRRLIKHCVENVLSSPFKHKYPEVPDKQVIEKLCMPPYQPGDILYVRETWMNPCEECTCVDCKGCLYGEGFRYKADYRIKDNIEKWRPSIHMPKKAARIWLKVTDVRVERLHHIIVADPNQTIHNICSEGIEFKAVMENYEVLIKDFKTLWDSTIKKSDLDRYGWEANPWVWVIEFERCEKPEREV